MRYAPYCYVKKLTNPPKSGIFISEIVLILSLIYEFFR
jgi:hypothetical protein